MTFSVFCVARTAHAGIVAGGGLRAGKANFLTPEFSGHETIPGAMRKIRKNKGLEVVLADSRPLQVVEAAHAVSGA